MQNPTASLLLTTLFMQVDLLQPITHINGTPINEKKDGKEKDITLKDICIRALVTHISENKKDEIVSPEQKFKNGLLAETLYQNDTVELKAEEITLLKNRIGKIFTTEVVVSSWKLLDPEK